MPSQPMPRGRRGGGPVAFVLPSRLANFRLLQELDASHGPVSPNKLAALGARCECNAELAGQLNCTADSNPGTAFGNVDDLAVTLGKAIQHHPRGKIALHAPLGSLLAFEKNCHRCLRIAPGIKPDLRDSFRGVRKATQIAG